MEEQEPPYPWEAHFNEQYQTMFYFNTETGESTWEFPSGNDDGDEDYEQEDQYNNANEREGPYDEEADEEYLQRALNEFEDDGDEDNEQEGDESGDYEPVQQDEAVRRLNRSGQPVSSSPVRSGKSMIPQPARRVSSNQGMSVVERSNLMLQKKREKEHAIRAEREQRELQEIHDPLINKSSKSINRSVEHMLSWDEHRKQKLQERAMSRQFDEERSITGRPAITKKAVEVGLRRQQEDIQLQNQLLFGGDLDTSAEGADDQGSVVSGYSDKNTYVSGATSVASRPVEDRLLEYEERKKLKLQRAVEERNRAIRATATPMITHMADAVSVGREGDVVERLYYAGGGMRGGDGGGGGAGPSGGRAMQHDEVTGQKLFQPKMNPTSAALASKNRPAEVPVEVLLNYKGEVYKQKQLEKEKRLENKAKMVREAPKLNTVSAKLAERRQSVEGSTLAKPIGNLKPRTVKELPEHSFKPQISKGSQEIIRANSIHYQVTSESVYNNSSNGRVERNNRFSGYDYGDDDYGRSDPYYDERMVYGELEIDSPGRGGGGRNYYEEDDMGDDYSRAYDDEEEMYRNQGGGGRAGSFHGGSSGSGRPVNEGFGVLYDPSDSLMPTSTKQPAKPFNKNNRTQSMYDRTVQWEKERVERMKREKASKEKEEMKKCSFKPAVVRSGGPASHNNSFYDSGGNGVMSSNGTIADRQNEWARKREQKLEAERLKSKDDELKDCSFAPQRSTVKGSANRSRNGASGSRLNSSYDSDKINASLDSIAAAVANIGTGLGGSGSGATISHSFAEDHHATYLEDDDQLYDYGKTVPPPPPPSGAPSGRVPIPVKSSSSSGGGNVPVPSGVPRVPVAAYTNYVDTSSHRDNYQYYDGTEEEVEAPAGRVPLPVKAKVNPPSVRSSGGSGVSISNSASSSGAKGRVGRSVHTGGRVDFSASTKGPAVSNYYNDMSTEEGISLDQQLFVEAAMDQYVDDFEREEQEFAREYASLSGGGSMSRNTSAPASSNGYGYRSRGNYDLREPDD